MNSKRKKVALLSFLMAGAFAAGAAASNGIERVDAYLRPDFKLVVDGVTAQMDKPILIYDNTSYLPVRTISSLLGADVNWDNSSNTAYINSRYKGQPEMPVDSSDYKEIELMSANPMVYKYLGRDYGIMTFYGDAAVYYRVIDLNRMGVDTKGLLKYREKNTHDMYVVEEDVQKIWKETPVSTWNNGTVMSGVYDSKTREYIQSMIQDSIPLQFSGFPYTVLTPFASVFFVDAVENHPNHYAMYYWNDKGGIGIIMVVIEKDSNDQLVRRSFTTMELQYYYKYFSE